MANPTTGLGVGIQRQSTTEQTAEAIRRAVLSGRLPPGMPLREAAVAAELGVSRSIYAARTAVELAAVDALTTHRDPAVYASLADLVDRIEHAFDRGDTTAVLEGQLLRRGKRFSELPRSIAARSLASSGYFS